MRQPGMVDDVGSERVAVPAPRREDQLWEPRSVFVWFVVHDKRKSTGCVVLNRNDELEDPGLAVGGDLSAPQRRSRGPTTTCSVVVAHLKPALIKYLPQSAVG
jgi:hypothetical protein